MTNVKAMKKATAMPPIMNGKYTLYTFIPSIPSKNVPTRPVTIADTFQSTAIARVRASEVITAAMVAGDYSVCCAEVIQEQEKWERILLWENL